MDQSAVERRLAAILAADMVGYSRLMEADETGTLARLKAHRVELIDPAIAKNKGRLIKTTGDGLLVEFQSVADAVACAVEVQRRMARGNADVPPTHRIEFRIGINLGDVIIEDGDIFGDGVNVAARLQALAEPGGICVSGAIRDQVGDRLGVAFDDLGERRVKNLARPIRIFRVRLGENTTPATPAPDPAAGPRPAVATVSDKPSIAVLPFVNMSGDPEQEFFTDGLTEDIITALSRFRDLFVISRNSAFVYKGKAVKAQDVAREFGVQYVVEGSVRKVAGVALHTALGIGTLGLMFGLLCTLLMGQLSDLLGRRRILVAATLATAIAVIPLLLLADRGTLLSAVAAQLGLALVMSCFLGTLPAVFVSLYPPGVRCSALSVGYNIAVALFGGTAPLVAIYLVKATGWSAAPGIYLAVTALICLALVPLVPEAVPGQSDQD